MTRSQFLVWVETTVRAPERVRKLMHPVMMVDRDWMHAYKAILKIIESENYD